MKAQIVSTEDFYIGDENNGVLIPNKYLHGIIQDLLAIEASKDPRHAQIMSNTAAESLVANDSWSVGGVQKEIRQCEDIEKRREGCERLGFDCKGEEQIQNVPGKILFTRSKYDQLMKWGKQDLTSDLIKNRGSRNGDRILELPNSHATSS